LLGRDAVGRAQVQHEYLYWEYRNQTAVRMQQWKAIQAKADGRWELYDLGKDVSEAHNIAAAHPAVLAQMKAFAVASHDPVRPGSFADRVAHERDRWAKWGDSPDKPAPRGKARTR